MKSEIFRPEDEDWYANAVIGWGGQDLDWAYVDGFYHAGKILCDQAVEQHLRDTLIFPIIFNYRHYIELCLKYFSKRIKLWKMEAFDEAEYHGHKLTSHLESVNRGIMETLGPKWAMSHKLKQVVINFQNEDPRNEKYRYTTDKEGRAHHNPRGHRMIGLFSLRDDLEQLYNYFYGVDCILEQMFDARAEMYDYYQPDY